MFFVIKMAYFALFCNFFLQRFAHFKKKQYFCTRFLIEGTCAEKKTVKKTAFIKKSENSRR